MAEPVPVADALAVAAGEVAGEAAARERSRSPRRPVEVPQTLNRALLLYKAGYVNAAMVGVGAAATRFAQDVDRLKRQATISLRPGVATAMPPPDLAMEVAEIDGQLAGLLAASQAMTSSLAAIVNYTPSF